MLGVVFESLHERILVDVRELMQLDSLLKLVNFFLKLFSFFFEFHLKAFHYDFLRNTFCCVCADVVSTSFRVWNFENVFSVNLLHMSLHALCSSKFSCAF